MFHRTNTIYYPVQNISIFVWKKTMALNNYLIAYRTRKMNFTSFSIWDAQALFFLLIQVNVSDL
jgi:hypothetical protein